MKLEATPKFLRTGVVQTLGKVPVDREKQIIYGYNVAELGPFKSQGRGEFDMKSLNMIAEQMNAMPKGLKSRFTHPGLSSDGLGKYLGRAKNARVEGNSVKADLHLDPTSRKTPSGDLGGYVMDLAESDAEALGSSVVIIPDRVKRLDDKGKPQLGADGEPLPDFWYPKKLHASDVVDDGDAVHSGFLTSDIDFDQLPDAELRQGCVMLDNLFAGQTRDVVDARLKAFLSRYLDLRYGPSGLGLEKILEKDRYRG